MKVRSDELVVYAVAAQFMTRDCKCGKLENRILIVEEGEHSAEKAKESVLETIEKEWNADALGDRSDWALVAVTIGVQSIFYGPPDPLAAYRKIPAADCQWN